MDEKAKTPKKKVYYSMKASQAACVIMKEKDGSPRIRKDHKGNEIYHGNQPDIMTRTIKFQCISSNPSKGTLSIYETEDPDEIETLEKHAHTPGHDIMTEADYKKSTNREAFEKGLELDRLKQVEANKNTEIEDLKRRLEAAEKRNQGRN